jgi:hypothetical protein
MDPDDLVILRKFSHLHEAELAISALDAAHIDAVLRDAAYGGFRPEASIVGGGVTVMVRRREIEAANEVLDAPVLHDTSSDSVTCVNCGRQLQGTVCSSCDLEERETYMTPATTRAAIGRLKIVVIAATLALAFLPTMIDRLKNVDERTWLRAFMIVGGVLLAIVLFKALVISNDERL